MVPVRALAVLLGLPRVDPFRLALATALLIVAMGLTIIGLLHLVAALQAYLGFYLSPPLVDLSAGVVVLMVAIALFVAARRLARPLPALEVGNGDLSNVAAQALRWVQENPKQAAIVAAILGFLAGAMPETRQALNEILYPRR